MSMSWEHLLSPLRLGEDKQKPRSGTRTDFERDYDRVLFSSPFRRLRGKTQVFPLPDNDHVHTRMTHSLEVASVGRSLGKGVGDHIIEQYDLAKMYHRSDFGDIVAAACLAHDIGNPPFGHSGEDAMAAWFREHREAGGKFLDGLNEAEIADLENFEGNAQGLRILTRLSMYRHEGGMRLTHASLGTFAKYPQASTQARKGEGVSRKKFTYFQSEKEIFAEIADATGLKQRADGSWHRHPLSFLVEAADDICYSILDAEDGYLLGHFHFDELVDLLRPFLSDNDIEQINQISHMRSRVSRMRALAIGQLIEETRHAYIKHIDAILDGSFDQSFIDVIPLGKACAQIVEACVPVCYNAPEVCQILLAGYRVIGDFLDRFVPAALSNGETRKFRQTLKLLPGVAHAQTPYEKILAVTDYIAGMTDSYAMNLYKSLNGISPPGQASLQQL